MKEWDREDMDQLLRDISEEIEARDWDMHDFGPVFVASRDFGAAVAFGLIGMAEAIRARRASRRARSAGEPPTDGSTRPAAEAASTATSASGEPRDDEPSEDMKVANLLRGSIPRRDG